MAALDGLALGALLSMPWAAGATRSWRHEPLGTQGMRVRTPSGGMACPGATCTLKGVIAFQRFRP